MRLPKVLIVHGYFDVITPYFSSKFLVNRLRRSNRNVNNIQLRNYMGGHMFYTYEASRVAFKRDAEAFYQG